MKIGFAGKMGAGKDISVKYLIKKYNGTKIAFSDPLYNILNYSQNICGFKNEKDRKFLQFIGTEWAREKDPDIWIKLALNNSPLTGNVYCSDIRFKNELNALKDNNWIIIKIIRNKFDNKRIGSGNKDHISENDIENIDINLFDYILYNNDSFSNLYSQLDEIVKDIIMKNDLEERIIKDINNIIN